MRPPPPPPRVCGVWGRICPSWMNHPTSSSWPEHSQSTHYKPILTWPILRSRVIVLTLSITLSLFLHVTTQRSVYSICSITYHQGILMCNTFSCICLKRENSQMLTADDMSMTYIIIESICKQILYRSHITRTFTLMICLQTP